MLRTHSTLINTDGTLPLSQIVPGKSFARIIQIWLENTDYHVAATSPTFQKLAKQGITLSSYLALTQWVHVGCAQKYARELNAGMFLAALRNLTMWLRSLVTFGA